MVILKSWDKVKMYDPSNIPDGDYYLNENDLYYKVIEIKRVRDHMIKTCEIENPDVKERCISKKVAIPENRILCVNLLGIENINFNFENEPVFDGVPFDEYKTVLLINQKDRTQNGVWKLVRSMFWRRIGTELKISDLVFHITEGKVFKDTYWECLNKRSINYGIDNLNFTQYTGTEMRV